MELLVDAAGLFYMAFRYLSDTLEQRVHQQIGEYFSVPTAEDWPGIQPPWGNEFRPMIEDGVR